MTLGAGAPALAWCGAPVLASEPTRRPVQERGAVSAEEHVAQTTYLLAAITALLAVVTGVSAGFLWAQLRAARRDAAEVAARERRQATMQFFADTLEIRRTMALDLPEDRDAEGIARLLEPVRGDSADARH